jgi:hypothetical protein
MMDFLGNICESCFLVICAVGLLQIAQFVRRKIDFTRYDDTE